MGRTRPLDTICPFLQPGHPDLAAVRRSPIAGLRPAHRRPRRRLGSCGCRRSPAGRAPSRPAQRRAWPRPRRGSRRVGAGSAPVVLGSTFGDRAWRAALSCVAPGGRPAGSPPGCWDEPLLLTAHRHGGDGGGRDHGGRGDSGSHRAPRRCVESRSRTRRSSSWRRGWPAVDGAPCRSARCSSSRNASRSVVLVAGHDTSCSRDCVCGDAQGGQPAGDAAADRADPAAESGGDVLVAEVLVVAQHDRRPLPRRQPRQLVQQGGPFGVTSPGSGPAVPSRSPGGRPACRPRDADTVRARRRCQLTNSFTSIRRTYAWVSLAAATWCQRSNARPRTSVTRSPARTVSPHSTTANRNSRCRDSFTYCSNSTPDGLSIDVTADDRSADINAPPVRGGLRRGTGPIRCSSWASRLG